MGGRGDAGQALQERVRRGVEELIGDTEDSAVADCVERLPIALSDDAFEGDAIPCSTPSEEEYVRTGFGYRFRSGVGAGFAQVFASGGLYEFGDPGLGVDEGFAPLFAVDDGGLGAALTALARGFDGGLHLVNEGLGFRLRVDQGGDEADVFVDVGEGVRRESENGQARFQDFGEGLHAVGDAGYD